MTFANPKFWHGKRVLLTGHTGFKGAWMAIWLNQMGAKVAGVSLPPSCDPNLFTLAKVSQITSSHFMDIRDECSLSSVIKKVQPEIVFHFAAQSLVRPAYKDPLGTFETNIMGTANVLNTLREIESVKAVVAVTTDKVYKNLEQLKPYSENDTLGGHDPYSASKAASEIIISSYRDSYLNDLGIAVASARAGNVIGGGDWSEDRLIPDAIRAWSANLPLEIRKPNAVRPWQHVLEPLNAYLVLAEKLYSDLSLAGAYNFGPRSDEAASVRRVIELAHKAYGYGEVLWGSGAQGPHEAGLLSLDVTKASEVLAINPRWNLEMTIERTMGWYLRQKSGANALALCGADIDAYTA